MVLTYCNLTKEEIIKLSSTPKPGDILNIMSFEELETLNAQISELISEPDIDSRVYEKLMHLRSQIVFAMWSS